MELIRTEYFKEHSYMAICNSSSCWEKIHAEGVEEILRKNPWSF